MATGEEDLPLLCVILCQLPDKRVVPYRELNDFLLPERDVGVIREVKYATLHFLGVACGEEDVSMKPLAQCRVKQWILKGICALLWLASGLQAGDVKTFPAPNVSFSQYKTFQWLPIRIAAKTGMVENDPRLSPLIRESVTKQLTKIGLVETKENPDLQVSAGAMEDASVQLEAIIYSMAPAGIDWAIGYPVATVSRYNRSGTLVVNLIDPKGKKSVWLGLVSKGLGMPDQAQGKIESASEKLFKKFPQRVK